MQADHGRIWVGVTIGYPYINPLVNHHFPRHTSKIPYLHPPEFFSPHETVPFPDSKWHLNQVRSHLRSTETRNQQQSWSIFESQFDLKKINTKWPSLAILSRPRLRPQLGEDWRGCYLGPQLQAPGIRLLSDLGYGGYGGMEWYWIYGGHGVLILFKEVSLMLTLATLLIIFCTDFSEATHLPQ